MSENLPNGDGIVEFWREEDSFFLALDLGDEGGYREFTVSRREIELQEATLEMLLDERFSWEENDG